MPNTIRDEYVREVNKYFNHLRKCYLKHPHSESECCYIGTTAERWAKYQEIEKREMEKKAKMEELPLIPPKLVRSDAINIIKKTEYI